VFVAGGADEADFEPVNRPSTNRGCGLGALIVLLIIGASIGVPLWLAAQDGGFGTFGSSLSFADASPLLLPGEPSGPQQFVAMTSRYDSGRGESIYSLVRSDGVSEDPVWTADLGGQASGERPILSDGTSAIVVVDATVTAVSLQSGAVAWTAALTDVVQFSSCVGCFEVYGSTVVALTADGNVQALDTTTGEARWSRRLDDTSRQGYDTGAHYVVLDGVGGDYRLITLDPATGTEVASFTPTCVDPGNRDWVTELTWTSTLLASSTPGRIWFLDGSAPTCIQQYDVTTGAMVSEAIADDESGSLTSSPRMVETPLGLVITSYQTLGLVDPTGTTYRQVVAGQDTDLVAVGATDAAIIVNATNRRGTATTSIRAIDPNTGATFWEASMGTATAVDTEDQPPGSYAGTSLSTAGTYAAAVDGPAVRVLTMREYGDDDQQLVLDSFDAVTGTAQPSVTLEGESDDIIPYLGPGVWNGSRLVTAAGDDQMLLVDFATMSVPYRFR
jgi:outer membrane protein assembly factor BamB